MKKIVLSVLAVCFSVWAVAQGHDPAFALTVGDKVEDLMLEYYGLGDFNGSLLLIEKGEVVYENTFGYADVESRNPLDADTPFYLASLSKQFTATAIMILVEQGKVSFSDNISRFLPLMPPAYYNITIEHLLTHTSGVKDYFSLGLYKTGLTNNDVYEALVNQRSTEFKAGHKYRYSNSGYVLLAMIVQIASGKMYPEFMRENIFEPLNMNSTYVHTATVLNDNRVKGYTTKFKLNDYELLTYGDGGIYSTARDMMKWEQSIYEAKLVSRATFARAFTPVILENGSERRYGFGWEIGNNLDGKFIYHSGGLAGFRTYMEQHLDEQNAIIILSNNSSAKILEIRNTLVKIMDGRPYSLPESN